MSFKKAVLAVSLTALMLGNTVFAAANYSYQSNRYTQLETTGKAQEKIWDLEGFSLVAQNENLELYLNESNASLRIRNKENGYVWGALSAEQPENLNKQWYSFGNSLISMKYFDETGNTQQIGAGHPDAIRDYEYSGNGVTCSVSFPNIGISLSAGVELLDDRIQFSLDDKSIVEEGKYMVGNVYFLPFLGSTLGDEISGYMFVPDGCGALIRYHEPTKYLSGYDARVFGSDLAIDNLFEISDLKANRTNDFTKDLETITMPVYGLTHGENGNALFGHVDDGAEYAGIYAEPAGIITDYNYVTAYFIYRQLYQQPTSREGSGVQMVQQKMNHVNPRLSVYFLSEDDASYSGMAGQYRQILEKEGALPEYSAMQSAKVYLDFVAADRKKGFLFDSTVTATDIKEMEDAARYLSKAGVEDVQFTLQGWQPRGLNGYEKLAVAKKSEIGSLEELQELKAKLENQGYGFCLYSTTFSAKEPQIKSKGSNVGITLSQARIIKERDNKDAYLGDTLYVKSPKALEALKEQTEQLEKYGLTQSLAEAGSLLYGEYLRGESSSRTEVKKEICKTLQKLTDEERLALYGVNEYALFAAAVYRDTPMTSSRYLFETDSVPFLQMVLSGSITLVAPYTNQSFYTTEDVLKCVEYNCHPSFLLTGKDSSELKKTVISESCSTGYDGWKEMIVSITKEIDAILSPVQGQKMISHKVLKEGLVRVTYDNGEHIYVNYTDEDCDTEDGVVKAESAMYTGLRKEAKSSGKAEKKENVNGNTPFPIWTWLHASMDSRIVRLYDISNHLFLLDEHL